MDANRKSMTLVADQLAMARQVAGLFEPPSIIAAGPSLSASATPRRVAPAPSPTGDRPDDTNGKPCASSTSSNPLRTQAGPQRPCPPTRVR